MLRAALVDVGGTLWPNSWVLRQGDHDGRVARVWAALPQLRGSDAADLVQDIATQSSDANGGDVSLLERVRVDADTVVARCLRSHAVPVTPATVARVRRAMGLPVDDRITPLPGARELLAAIHDYGLKCVIASNTCWRDAQDYWEDFRQLDMAEHIDAIVTSVDAGRHKPHPAVFEMSFAAAGASPGECVMIGNKESNDIEPAVKLGMRSILVYPDDPRPETTRADAMAADLWECAAALAVMLGESA